MPERLLLGRMDAEQQRTAASPSPAKNILMTRTTRKEKLAIIRATCKKNVILKAAPDENVSSQGANGLKLVTRSIWKLPIVSTLVLRYYGVRTQE